MSNVHIFHEGLESRRRRGAIHNLSQLYITYEGPKMDHPYITFLSFAFLM